MFFVNIDSSFIHKVKQTPSRQATKKFSQEKWENNILLNDFFQ